jgi:hypothetical protein
MAIFQNNLLAGAGAQSSDSTYAIDQSIRFSPSDSTYMYRTQDTADSKRKLSLSWWMKRGSTFGTELCLFAAGASSRFMARIHTDDKMTLRLTNGTTEKTMTTDMVFRDPSAWYHCLWVADCTGSISSEFSRLYVNGARVTMTGTQPSADTDFAGYGDGSTFGISTNSHYMNGQVWDGYLAEMVLIDNQALDPSSFGEYNESNIWIPKDVSGLTFGTNGFYVDGRDSSDLGDDESGNGNDFTTSGLAAHDQVLDTPTNNFAVLNPVDTFSKLAGELRNGNLELKDNSASVYVHGRATFGFDVTDSDGWYWESCDVVDGSQIGGITEDNAVIPSGSDVGFTGARGSNSVNTNFWYKLDGTTYASTSLGVNSNAGDIAQFCVKNGKLFIGINGTYVLSGNPATEANPLFTGLTGIFMPFGGLYSGFSYNTIYNFGQDGTFAGNKTAQGNTDANGYGNFFYAPPSGAKALCSKSLGS